MNVLMITPIFDTGGTEIYILNLIRYLKSRKLDITVLTSMGKRIESLNEYNVKLYLDNGLVKKSIYLLIRSVFICRNVIKEREIDLIHSSSVYTTLIAKIACLTLISSKRKKVKIIYTMHGGPNKDIEKKSAKLLNFISDKVIALSKRSKRDLINYGLKEKKITVIYNGIDIKEKYSCNNTNDKKDIKIINCGRLTEQKGQIYLIRAFRKIIDINPRIKLYILGEGELEYGLKEEVKKLNLTQYIEFLGFRENPLQIVSEMDIVILPSLWEQFPITILEAMALSKPIIASNVNGVFEQIDGCGILIRPANEDDIVESVLCLVKDNELRDELAKKAYDKYINNFNLEKMGSLTLDAYNKILY